MLDKLKAFFNGEIDLSSLKKVVDLRDLSFKILNTDGNNNALVKIDNSKIDKSIHVTLNVQASDIKDPELLAERVGIVLQEHVQEENKPILEISASETIEELSKPNQYQSEIDFFANKIPRDDLLTLRAAYYLRTVHESGGSVTILKQSLTARYGTRGGNIANLCSGGYFESYLRPLYNMLSERDNFTEQMFLDNYEIIVNNAPFAYFVHNNQDILKLIESIKEKITFSRRYGQHKLAIHAIGRENIGKVNSVLEDESILELISEEIDTTTKGSVMTVTVRYKD